MILELVVCYFLLKWLLKRKTGEPFSKKTVAKFLGLGALSVVVALGFSIVTPIERDMFFGFNPVLALVVPILAHTLYDLPIISLMATIGDADIDALRNADIEAVMQLPYFNYFIPLSVCVFAVMIDSGANCPNALELAKELTNKPVMLINTHGDGVGGQF
jgi:hypothetical protein